MKTCKGANKKMTTEYEEVEEQQLEVADEFDNGCDFDFGSNDIGVPRTDLTDF